MGQKSSMFDRLMPQVGLETYLDRLDSSHRAGCTIHDARRPLGPCRCPLLPLERRDSLFVDCLLYLRPGYVPKIIRMATFNGYSRSQPPGFT